MAVSDLFQHVLDEVRNQATDINLYFIERKKRQTGVTYEIYQTQIDDPAADGFRKVFLDQMAAVLAEPDLQLIAYNPGDFDERPSLYTLPVQQIPACQELLQKLAAHQSMDFPPRLNQAFLNRLWAYAVTIETPNKTLTYFRKYTPTKVIQDRKMGLLFDGGHFNAIRGEVFSIDANMDCLCLADQMFIFNGNAFENIFGYREWHQQTAQALLVTLGGLGTFHGLDTVSAAWAQDFRKARKLASIARSGNIDKVDYDKFRDVARRYNLKITFDEQQRQIDVTQSDVWELLKLLDDDYLTSPMTAGDYEVNAKRRKK